MKPKIICIVGPTASGKSALAHHICAQFQGEIVNADSRQFYREMTVGTAKPTLTELTQIPHHLIDCATITDPWNVARFVTAAKVAIADIQHRQKIPVLVGGTGLYVKSILFGLDEIPAISQDIHDEVQQIKNNSGVAGLHARLQQLDGEGAERLNPNDSQRLERALSVVLQTGLPIHQFWQANQESEYDYVKIGLNLDRKILYDRINERVMLMLQQGLRDEALTLYQSHPDNIVLQKTIGYQEWGNLGFGDSQAVMALIQKNTRNFAKRQITWFGRESDVTWLHPEDQVNVLEFVRSVAFRSKL